MGRALPLINILLGAVIIVIAATMISGRLASRLTAVFTPKQGTAVSAAGQAKTEELGAYGAITGQGLFGKATRGALTPVTSAPSGAAPSAPAAAIGELQLLGTAVGTHRETFALVRHATRQEERVFRLGDSVFDTGRLSAVTREKAFIVINGKRVELTAPTAPPSAVPSSPAAPKTDGGVQVTSLGGGNFVLDQRALNNALDNPAQIMTAARLLPVHKSGKIEGFRASEVKPGELFALIGIRNGDVLVRLNDFPIDGPDKALQSLVALKGQNRLKLDIIRDGQPQTMNYEIR